MLPTIFIAITITIFCSTIVTIADKNYINEHVLVMERQLSLLDIDPYIPPTNQNGWVNVGVQTYYSNLGYANDKTNEISLSVFFTLNWALSSSPTLNNPVTLTELNKKIWLPKLTFINGNSQYGRCFEIHE